MLIAEISVIYSRGNLKKYRLAARHRAVFFLSQPVDLRSQSVTVMSGDYTEGHAHLDIISIWAGYYCVCFTHPPVKFSFSGTGFDFSLSFFFLCFVNV